LTHSSGKLGVFSGITSAIPGKGVDGRDKPTAVRLGIELSMRKYLRDAVFCWFGLS
jgi:hypothetical protein